MLELGLKNTRFENTLSITVFSREINIVWNGVFVSRWHF
jgi:hypothetical protein